jgi:hypothetical protein
MMNIDCFNNGGAKICAALRVGAVPALGRLAGRLNRISAIGLACRLARHRAALPTLHEAQIWRTGNQCNAWSRYWPADRTGRRASGYSRAIAFETIVAEWVAGCRVGGDSAGIDRRRRLVWIKSGAARKGRNP